MATMNQAPKQGAQQGIEQQVVQLVQAAAAGDQKATQQIEKIMQAAQQGNQEAIQIAQIIQKVVQAMQAKQGVKARLGAKLAYINRLKGNCPEGEELVYMKRGGRVCPVCQKKVEKAQGGEKVKDPVKQRKIDMSKAKDQAARDSIAINKYNHQETMINSGHKGKFNPNKKTESGGATWEPDRSKYNKTEKKACGSKLKKKK